jgi:phosphoribosylanthranilate isomerase
MATHVIFEDFIQVAGIVDMEEAKLVIDCGVRYLGFPLRLPVNSEDLSEAHAAEIIKTIAPPAFGVVITYQRDADEIAEFIDYLGASIVQLHGEITVGEVERLKQLRPNLKVIKSLVVGESRYHELVTKVQSLGDFVDAFITDTFDPETGASGATGRTHDWQVSLRLVQLSPVPIILAGGLTPENVREAISLVGPAGVDVHTGVENVSGRKDPARVRAFVAEACVGFSHL